MGVAGPVGLPGVGPGPGGSRNPPEEPEEPEKALTPDVDVPITIDAPPAIPPSRWNRLKQWITPAWAFREKV